MNYYEQSNNVGESDAVEMDVWAIFVDLFPFLFITSVYIWRVMGLKEIG